MANNEIHLNVELSGIDEAIEKSKMLCETIKTAKSLASDLAVFLADMNLEVDV